MSYVIYKITSPKNRIYIGQSTCVIKRWNQHRFYDYDSSILLGRSIKKYGWENHKFEIIEECLQSELDYKEIFWIEHYKSFRKKYPLENGFNLTSGGSFPPINSKCSTKTKKKLIGINNKINHANKRIKNIKQYDIRGNVIKIWDNVHEFDKNSIYKYPMVIKCCEGKVICYKKYIWRFNEDKFTKYKTSRGKKMKINSIEYSEFQRKKATGRKATQNTKEKMSISFWNNRKKDEYSKLISKRFKGKRAYWKEGKQSKELIKKRIDKIKKPIIQCDLEGNKIKEWLCAKEVQNITGINAYQIGKNCKNNIKEYKGYIWKYKMDGNIKEKF